MSVINEFLDYLKNERKTADNTVLAYKRDICAFERFANGRGIFSPLEVTNAEVVSYLIQLKNDGKSKGTVNRKLASIRSFYNYMQRMGRMSVNPTEDIKSPKIDRKELEFLTIEEVEQLLAQPDESVKGIRDRAILELMYATGIKVSEVIELKLSDMNLHMGFVSCSGSHGRARIVPMGNIARETIQRYIDESRNFLMRGENVDDPDREFFVNYMGKPFTRQGLWKIMKEYGVKSGMEHKITPHILRNSFAVHMIQNGADLKSLQELLGHEDISATQIYLSVTKNRIKDVYDKTHPRA